MNVRIASATSCLAMTRRVTAFAVAVQYAQAEVPARTALPIPYPFRACANYAPNA